MFHILAYNFSLSRETGSPGDCLGRKEVALVSTESDINNSSSFIEHIYKPGDWIIRSFAIGSLCQPCAQIYRPDQEKMIMRTTPIQGKSNRLFLRSFI